jgi:prolyl-tRNA synthetase
MAPKQIVIVPMLRGKPEDAELKEYCTALAAALNKQSVFDNHLRAWVDTKDAKPTDKRWDWVRRGAPIICEIGPRDAAGGQVTFIQRTALREGEKVKSTSIGRDEFIDQAPGLLEAIQKQLFEEAKQRLDANITSDLKSWDELANYYGAGEDESEVKGWARVAWAKPSGAELEKVGERLKTLKLTIRNAPLLQPSTFGACVFTGKPGVEEILIARAY